MSPNHWLHFYYGVTWDTQISSPVTIWLRIHHPRLCSMNKTELRCPSVSFYAEMRDRLTPTEHIVFKNSVSRHNLMKKLTENLSKRHWQCRNSDSLALLILLFNFWKQIIFTQRWSPTLFFMISTFTSFTQTSHSPHYHRIIHRVSSMNFTYLFVNFNWLRIASIPKADDRQQFTCGEMFIFYNQFKA